MANYVQGVFLRLDVQSGNKYPILDITNCVATSTPKAAGGITVNIAFDSNSGIYQGTDMDEEEMQRKCKAENLLFLQFSSPGTIDNSAYITGVMNPNTVTHTDVGTITLNFKLLAGKVNGYLAGRIVPAKKTSKPKNK
jgi:hypothetical protein